MARKIVNLGKFITQLDNRARDSKYTYSLSDIAGISSITKEFTKTKANLIDVTVDSYKICPPNCFAYNPNTARMGDKIPIALNKTKKDFLVSSIYPVFQLDETKILSEFLLLFFKREEFDRYARYMSTGSAREIFDWDEMCRVELPIPDLVEQKHIINAYNTVERRISLLQKINEKLEATAQCLFDALFMDSKDFDIELNDIDEINPERALKKGTEYKCFDMSSLPTKSAVPFGYEMKSYNGGMKFRNGDTLMARITPCLENGKAAYINILNKDEIAFGSTEYIVLSPKNITPSSFNYFLVRNAKFINYAIKHMNGSSGRQRVSGDDIGKFKLKKPTEIDFNKFDLLGSQVLNNIKENSIEIEKLQNLKQLIISRISEM